MVPRQNLQSPSVLSVLRVSLNTEGSFEKTVKLPSEGCTARFDDKFCCSVRPQMSMIHVILLSKTFSWRNSLQIFVQKVAASLAQKQSLSELFGNAQLKS